jgi:hypothetical protein
MPRKRRPETAHHPPLGDAKKHDWTTIRRTYIRGGDDVTLEYLSHQPGAPHLGSLKRRCAAEDWLELRQTFRDQVATKQAALEAEMQDEVAKQVLKIRQQHVKIGAAMLGLAARGMKHIDVQGLGDLGVTRLARAGGELQRKALGLEQTNVNIRVEDAKDLRRLSDAELLELAREAAIEAGEEGADQAGDESAGFDVRAEDS